MSIHGDFYSSIEFECKAVIENIIDGIRELDGLPHTLWASLPQEAIEGESMDLEKVELILNQAIEDDLFSQVERLGEIADEVDCALARQELEAAQPQPEAS